MDRKISLTFDKSVKKEVLEVFDKTVNEEGIIIEKDSKQPVLSSEDGQEIHIDEFGGIAKGSEIFIKNDIVSLMKFARRK